MSQHIIVISHRRSGTHLTIDTIINNFSLYRDNPPISTLTLDHLSEHVVQKKTTLGALSKLLRQQPCVLKSHTHSELDNFFIGDRAIHELVKALFETSKIIYVYRDGRDVLVSLYYYAQLFDAAVKNMSFGQFIRMPNTFDYQTYSGNKDRPNYWKFHVNSWLSNPNILCLSFQSILNEYEATIHRIGDFIDQPVGRLSDVRRTTMLKETRLGKFLADHVTWLQPKMKYSSVGFRKGKSGDWRNHFSPEDLQFFEERVGDFNLNLMETGLGQ